jgi:SAM-dependent methyltransferase
VGFVQAPPNATLLQFAERELEHLRAGCLLDIGCGAARNALPLARSGWDVLGTDSSRPMLEAAAGRARAERTRGRLYLASALMDSLPVRDRTADLIVAHGIWNLARSSAEFRRAVREAARVARPGAGLFLVTFSRNTLPATVAGVAGEPFVFTQFAGEPQCFLTQEQLLEELGRAGFAPEPAVPLRELNRPAGMIRTSGPVLYEGAFRFTGQPGRGGEWAASQI